ncbi:hypothetical protein [Streptomyces sp. NPDC057636]|uniref:hypothetical protein n=1 Tax=Streptomyces sp. NPDC057636 TaxID=3346189 RepID=UPI0036761E9E
MTLLTAAGAGVGTRAFWGSTGPSGSMDDGIATVGAAVIGLVAGGGSALLSGLLAYKAGRRQVHDQGLATHQQWLLQQRQEGYVSLLSACDAFVDGLDACFLALGTAEATGDMSLYEGALECVDVEVYLNTQQLEGGVDHQLGKILMLGPATVSQQAKALRASVRAARDDLAHLTNGLIPHASPPPELEGTDDWWSRVERARDEVAANRSAFVAAAYTSLTDFKIAG